MIRKIIQIDTDKCNGCGACANACHEGAIAMVNGKAKLMRDDYWDGFGDCLPPIAPPALSPLWSAKPPLMMKRLWRKTSARKPQPPESRWAAAPATRPAACSTSLCRKCTTAAPAARCARCRRKPEPAGEDMPVLRSQLSQWPVQIKLVPVRCPPTLMGPNC